MLAFEYGASGAAVISFVFVDILSLAMSVRPSILLLVVVALTVSAACVGQLYVHRRFSQKALLQHNEVGGFIIAVAGTLYAVVLGFLTVVGSQHFSDARGLVADESAAATDTWHMAVGLPSARRREVRHDMLRYANVMIENEWPLMRHGAFDIQGDFIVMDAIGAAEAFKPADLGQSNAQSATLQQLGVVHDVRQRRLADNASGISRFEWLVLLVGATCMISFCWLFGVANRAIHLLMTSAVAVLISSTLILLFELQYPFRSGTSIPAEDWKGVVAHIELMQKDEHQTNMHM